MVDINKHFTMEDLEKFHAIIRELPKVPTRVRVGKGVWVEITRVAVQYVEPKNNKECGYVREMRGTPVILDEDLAPCEYEVDYN